MKKTTSIISSIFALSILAGCTLEPINYLPVISSNPVQNTAKVTAQSTAGLNKFYDFMVKYTFNCKDQNKDSYLSFDEFKSYSMFDGNMFDVNTPQPVQISPSGGYYPNNSQDILKRFEKMDKNNDAKLSFSEVKGSKDFITSKNEIQATAKTSFKYMDKNLDNKISNSEFLGLNGSYAGYLTNAIFALADKNNDGFLSFSEFEDLGYTVMQSNLANPVPPSYPPTPYPIVSSSSYPTPAVTSSAYPIPLISSSAYPMP